MRGDGLLTELNGHVVSGRAREHSKRSVVRIVQLRDSDWVDGDDDSGNGDGGGDEEVVDEDDDVDVDTERTTAARTTR